MAKIQWKGGALLGPLPPTMVTCRANGKDNVLTVAWTGILNTDPPKTYISVRPSRFSYGLIRESGVFAVNLTTVGLVKRADLCGIHTGKNTDKFGKYDLHKEEAREIDCPLLSESPVSLECRVTDVVPLGTHDMFLADIVAVDVDETLLDEAGKLHLERAGLVAYAHGEYYALGKKLAGFGDSVRKKRKPGKREKK